MSQKSSSSSIKLAALVSESRTIEVARTHIEYDPELSKRAGFLRIERGDPPIVPPHGDTILHLLFFLIYTEEGRSLLDAHRGWATPRTPEVIRDKLKTALREKFPALEDDRLEAVLDAHFAADGYVAAVEANDEASKQQHEAVYSQKLLAILGAVHDDAMGHDFSLDW